ncbi:hypothetical protein [Cytobacillus sp. IB215316]|uniref:hypothetical protein n=1 Tax=Cytobacillus sp. IB215316 TaxID=3097354 RepID=UPI002A0D533F|nr:hypothetical protein [Cytobacillus sp. IB215316]MDX8361512.1 hypothetical protein [Cytobacillus sp. IB215316]
MINSRSILNIEDVLVDEEKYGSHHDDFMALANLSKELNPTSKYDINNLLDIWKKYRKHNEKQNLNRTDPSLFSGFKEIHGLQYLKDCVEQGGVFATYHYGDYRHVPVEIVKSLDLNENNSIDMVVDNESYHSEMSLTLWKELKEELFIKFIVSESETSGLKLLRKLRNGRSILLYLDGNSGSGDDSYPAEVNHISSRVQIRSGIFRLIQMLKKPLCVVLADHNDQGEARLTAYPLITISKDNLQEGIDQSYEIFTKNLEKSPHLWRFWFRHHKYVNEWNRNSNHSEHKIHWRNRNGTLGVDLSTGNIYKI